MLRFDGVSRSAAAENRAPPMRNSKQTVGKAKKNSRQVLIPNRHRFGRQLPSALLPVPLAQGGSGRSSQDRGQPSSKSGANIKWKFSYATCTRRISAWLEMRRNLGDGFTDPAKGHTSSQEGDLPKVWGTQELWAGRSSKPAGPASEHRHWIQQVCIELRKIKTEKSVEECLQKVPNEFTPLLNAHWAHLAQVAHFGKRSRAVPDSRSGEQLGMGHPTGNINVTDYPPRALTQPANHKAVHIDVVTPHTRECASSRYLRPASIHRAGLETWMQAFLPGCACKSGMHEDMHMEEERALTVWEPKGTKRHTGGWTAWMATCPTSRDFLETAIGAQNSTFAAQKGNFFSGLRPSHHHQKLP
ncbi:hypothetical protein DFH09DRAFT_1088127 [Mycena vulgaris]|nr:hypothetical protein DFH09DRAFT_1088127 [Mycena vulgaris]